MPYDSDNAEMLKRGIREGIFRKEIDIELTNKCLLEVMRMPSDKDTFSSEDADKSDMLRNFYINYLRGLSTPKGLELINFYDKKHRQ
jgi:hypothetical protein